VIEHARHDCLTKAKTEIKSDDPMDSEKTAETMETIKEDEELNETVPSDGVASGNTKEDVVQDIVNENKGQRQVSVNNDKDDDTSEVSNDNPKRGDKPARDGDQPEAADKANATEVISISLDEEPAPVQQVDPKKWRELHDEWLHAPCERLWEIQLYALFQIWIISNGLTNLLWLLIGQLNHRE